MDSGPDGVIDGGTCTKNGRARSRMCRREMKVTPLPRCSGDGAPAKRAREGGKEPLREVTSRDERKGGGRVVSSALKRLKGVKEAALA